MHGTRPVTGNCWGRRKAANPISDPQQAASTPPRVRSPECWGHCPPSLGTPAPHLQRHAELELLSVVAEHAPGCAQQQVMHHLLLCTGHVLLGEGDLSTDEAAGTSTGPCGRHWGDSALVWLSPAELTPWRGAQAHPTPRSSSAAWAPLLCKGPPRLGPPPPRSSI